MRVTVSLDNFAETAISYKETSTDKERSQFVLPQLVSAANGCSELLL